MTSNAKSRLKLIGSNGHLRFLNKKTPGGIGFQEINCVKEPLEVS